MPILKLVEWKTRLQNVSDYSRVALASTQPGAEDKETPVHCVHFASGD